MRWSAASVPALNTWPWLDRISQLVDIGGSETNRGQTNAKFGRLGAGAAGAAWAATLAGVILASFDIEK
jgi:hypothetical protein